MDETSRQVQAALTATSEFQIINEINEGMNAYAYRAKQPNLSREVFIKAYYYSEDDRDDLLREPRLLVQATGGLQTNQNIVQVFDGRLLNVQGEQYFCLIMEYVSGQSLLKHIENNCVGQQDAVRLICGILNGISHLHSEPNRILHRDLKPANILLAGNVPKITDFGSCARLADGCLAVGASRHSPIYVPPEGWGVPSIYGFSSDLYQCGAVLYELINGPFEYTPKHWVPTSRFKELVQEGKPFEQMDDFAQSEEVNKGIEWFACRRRLLEHGRKPQPYLSSALKRIIAKATHPAHCKRYQSAAEFATAASRINVPNWVAISDDEFRCDGWRGYNWCVRALTKSAPYVEVTRAKTNSTTWRQIHDYKSTKLDEAFQRIENFR